MHYAHKVNHSKQFRPKMFLTFVTLHINLWTSSALTLRNGFHWLKLRNRQQKSNIHAQSVEYNLPSTNYDPLHILCTKNSIQITSVTLLLVMSKTKLTWAAHVYFLVRFVIASPCARVSCTGPSTTEKSLRQLVNRSHDSRLCRVSTRPHLHMIKAAKVQMCVDKNKVSLSTPLFSLRAVCRAWAGPSLLLHFLLLLTPTSSCGPHLWIQVQQA